jgi:hypothetical protein
MIWYGSVPSGSMQGSQAACVSHGRLREIERHRLASCVVWTSMCPWFRPPNEPPPCHSPPRINSPLATIHSAPRLILPSSPVQKKTRAQAIPSSSTPAGHTRLSHEPQPTGKRRRFTPRSHTLHYTALQLQSRRVRRLAFTGSHRLSALPVASRLAL